MAKPPILGYVVVRKHEFNIGAMELCFGHEFPQGGVLLWGDNVTVFKYRATAQAAICRTVIYYNRPPLAGPDAPLRPKDFKIQRLRERGKG